MVNSRDDAAALRLLFSVFNFAEHTLVESKTVFRINDKIEDAWKNDLSEIELSLTEFVLFKKK